MIVFDLPLFLVDVGQAESRHEGVVQGTRRGEIAHARIDMIETGKLSAFHVRLASRPKRKGPARRRSFASHVGSSRYFLAAFFLPATVRLGPLRVRAFVFVRWPRTGNPRR